MTSRYRPNAPRIIDDTVEGEALILDMVTGGYYSCAGASAIAWNALKRGASAPEVAGLLVSAFGVPADDAARDVGQFVDALVRDGLLVEADGSAASDASALDPAAATAAGGSVEYAPLAVERFSDLADLILLDPVHDVSDAGWPHTPE